MTLKCFLSGNEALLPVITDEAHHYDFFELVNHLMSAGLSADYVPSITKITLINSEIPKHYTLDEDEKKNIFQSCLAFRARFPYIRIHGIFSLLKSVIPLSELSLYAEPNASVAVSPIDYEYIVKGNLSQIQRIVASIGVNTRVNNKATLLSVAVEQGHHAVVQWLLTQPGIDVNAGDIHSRATPLHVAVSKGNQEFVEQLLQHPGINVNASKKGGEDTTPLHMAVILGFVDIVDSLLSFQHINPHPVNSSGKIPLQCGLDANQTEVVDLMINYYLFLMIYKPDYMRVQLQNCPQLNATLKRQSIALSDLLKSSEVAQSLDEQYLPLLKLISSPSPVGHRHPLQDIFYSKKRPMIFNQKTLLEELKVLVDTLEGEASSDELEAESSGAMICRK